MNTRFVNLFYFGIFIVSTSCSPINNTRYNEYLSLKYEIAECSTNYNYTRSTTLTGTAGFFKRGLNLIVQDSKLINMTLGDPLTNTLPIRFAEIAVYNSSNKIVQCGKTSKDGDLKAVDGESELKIPAIADTYTVRVFSRIHYTLKESGKPNFEINTAVKKDKYTNELYYISSAASSNGIDDISVNLTAYARQTESLEVNGGVFSILNSIYTAYDYIRNNTDTIDTTCLSKKLNIYWKIGFNPAQYYYPDKDPTTLSSTTFYDKADNSLYVSGGKLGNITLEATNHFDDFVVIHEFGHHVENMCGSLLSPGGSHYIVARVDPRLAWAEGWSNYFAGQVMYDQIGVLNPEFENKMQAAGFADKKWTFLFASEGFSDSEQNIGNGSGFMFDLKKDGKNPDSWQVGSLFGQPFDRVDPTKYFGEGHFREGAVSRGLFKLTHDCGTSGTCVDKSSLQPIHFKFMWQSMNKVTGIGQSIYPFKSSEAFLERLKLNVSVSAPWAPGYKTFNENGTSEALHLYSDRIFTTLGINRWQPYGQYLSTTSPSTTICSSGRNYIEPRVDDPVLTSTNSDQRYSNHFYTIDLNVLTGLDEISVKFDPKDGDLTEFDLLLFKENYFFNGDYACSTYNSSQECIGYSPSRSTSSDVLKSDRRSGSIDTKTIRGLQALDHSKRYLLNIRAYTANKSISPNTDYEYFIRNQNGDYLCPPSP